MTTTNRSRTTDHTALTSAVTALAEAEATLPAATGTRTAALPTLADVLEFLPDAYFLTDGAGVVQYANRASSMLIGHARAYALHKPLTALVVAEEQARFQARLAALADRSGSWVREWEQRLRPQRGRAATIVTVRVAPARDAAGTLLGYQWLFQDRTPLHEAVQAAALREQALQNQLAQLTATTRLQEQLLAHYSTGTE